MSSVYEKELARLAEEGRLRTLHPLSGREGCHVIDRGSNLLNLTSNDYLGLAGDRQLLRTFYAEMYEENVLKEFGLGSSSSRLLSGDSELAWSLEDLLAKKYQRPAALLFNSGYHANIGILPTLMGKNDLVLSDKLNHASIHDGLRLCRAKCLRFRHLDYEQLGNILADKRGDYEKVVIVSESVFSMDGDVADLRRLVELKREFKALLYVDEAHAVGLYGDGALGQAEEQGLLGEIDLLMATFGKALASIGAFLVCSKDIKDYLVNHSRSLIFTTALPPVVLRWNHFVFQRISAMAVKRKHLQELSEQLRQACRQEDLMTGGSTNIIPLIIGDNSLTVSLAEELRQEGYLILPIRPPAVPEGTSRFRLSLTADMNWQDLEGLPALIRAGLAS